MVKKQIFLFLGAGLLCLSSVAQSWKRKADFPGNARTVPISFSIGNLGYFGDGGELSGASDSSNFWRYSPLTDSWKALAPIPNSGAIFSEGFALGNLGYIKMGSFGRLSNNQFFEYDPGVDAWSAAPDFPIDSVKDAGSFVLNGLGYVLGGVDSTFSTIQQTCFVFDPLANAWSKKANLPDSRAALCGFSVNGVGYAGLGIRGFSPPKTLHGDTLSTKVYSYNPGNDTWTTLSNFPGTTSAERYGHFVLNNEVYFCMDSSQVWQYSPLADKWTRLPDAPFQSAQAAFILNGLAYIIETNSKAVWQFCPPVNLSAGSDVGICKGSSVKLNATGALNYIWSPPLGLSDTTIADPLASPSLTTPFCVKVNNPGGCTYTDTVVVHVFSLPSILASSARAMICQNDTTLLNVSAATTYTWTPVATLTNPNSATPIARPSANTKYYVTISDINGCMNTDSVFVQTFSLPVVSGTANPSTLCPGDTSLFHASGASVYAWSPAGSLSSSGGTDIKAYPVIPTTYTVTGTDANGCVSNSVFSLTVKPAPAVPLITENQSVLVSNASASNTWYFNDKTDGFNQTDTAKANGTYQVCVSNVQGCSSCSLPFNFFATAIKEQAFSGLFSVYPNPASAEFSVSYTLLTESEIKLTLYNMLGERTKTVFAGFVNAGSHILTVESKDLPKGMYCLKLEGSGNQFLYKQLIISE